MSNVLKRPTMKTRPNVGRSDRFNTSGTPDIDPRDMVKSKTMLLWMNAHLKDIATAYETLQQHLALDTDKKNVAAREYAVMVTALLILADKQTGTHRHDFLALARQLALQRAPVPGDVPRLREEE